MNRKVVFRSFLLVLLAPKEFLGYRLGPINTLNGLFTLIVVFAFQASSWAQTSLDIAGLSGTMASMATADSTFHRKLNGANGLQYSLLRSSFFQYSHLMDHHISSSDSGETRVMFTLPVAQMGQRYTEIFKVIDEIIFSYLFKMAPVRSGQLIGIEISTALVTDISILTNPIGTVHAGQKSSPAVKLERIEFNKIKSTLAGNIQHMAAGSLGLNSLYGIELKFNVNDFKEPEQVSFDLEVAFEHSATQYLHERFQSFVHGINQLPAEKRFNRSMLSSIDVNQLIYELYSLKATPKISSKELMSEGVEQALEQLLDWQTHLDYLVQGLADTSSVNIVVNFAIENPQAGLGQAQLNMSLNEYYDFEKQFYPTQVGNAYRFHFLHFLLAKIYEKGMLVGPLSLHSLVLQSKEKNVQAELDEALFKLRGNVVMASSRNRLNLFMQNKSSFDLVSDFVADFLIDQRLGSYVGAAMSPAMGSWYFAMIPPKTVFGGKTNPGFDAFSHYVALPDYVSWARTVNATRSATKVILIDRSRSALAWRSNPSSLYGASFKTSLSRSGISTPSLQFYANASAPQNKTVTGIGGTTSLPQTNASHKNGNQLNSAGSAFKSGTANIGGGLADSMEQHSDFVESKLKIWNMPGNWGLPMSDGVIGQTPADRHAAKIEVVNSRGHRGGSSNTFESYFQNRFAKAIESKRREQEVKYRKANERICSKFLSKNL